MFINTILYIDKTGKKDLYYKNKPFYFLIT